MLLQQTGPLVELLDQVVDLRELLLYVGPVILVVPLSQNLLVGLALLLDPGVILEVVHTI